MAILALKLTRVYSLGMKVSAYRKADLCSLVAIAMAIGLMHGMPELIMQAYWAGYDGTTPPTISWSQNAICGVGFILVIWVGFVLPERILKKAYEQHPAE